MRRIQRSLLMLIVGEIVGRVAGAPAAACPCVSLCRHRHATMS
jgi:hypothetical protein